jgi:hypothetical protein
MGEIGESGVIANRWAAKQNGELNMKTMSLESEPELQRVLWACYKYWQDESPKHIDDKVICYSWILDIFEKRFGSRFHQSRLQTLANFGFLQKDTTSRHGGRRYYKVIAPEQVYDLLLKWNLA